MKKTKLHKWTFTARFRRNAFVWKGSRLACQRIKEAVAEIKKLARKDTLMGAEGAIKFMEKLWPALQHVDSSSGERLPAEKAVTRRDIKIITL